MTGLEHAGEGLGTDTDAADDDLRAAAIGALLRSNRLILGEQDRVALLTGSQQLHLHGAAKDVRRGKPLFVHLDAELGAQVGDGGGGSFDSE